MVPLKSKKNTDFYHVPCCITLLFMKNSTPRRMDETEMKFIPQIRYKSVHK